MLPPLVPFQKFLVTQVIAPHGITDIVHAHKTNSYFKLFFNYGGSIVLTNELHYIQQDTILNFIFFIASAYHFRHDISIISPKLKPRFIYSVLFLNYLIKNPELFILYMTFLHVPNHYRMSWNYIKFMKYESLILIFSTSILSYFGYNYIESINNIPIMGIILGHVFYNEIVIKKNE